MRGRWKYGSRTTSGADERARRRRSCSIEAGRERTVVNFHPMRAVPGWRDAHAGEIHTWNGFAKGEPLVLQIEATQRSCPGGRAQVLYAVSKARRNQPVWEDLRKVRDGASC